MKMVIMKKKKGNLFCRLLAVMLSAVLTVGMMSGAAPETIQAAETENAEVRYSTDGGKNWTQASLLDAIGGIYSAGEGTAQIELLRDITLVGTAGTGNWTNFQQTLGYRNSTWTINGNGHTITRGEDARMLFCVNAANTKVILKNITIDGGAIWSGDDPATRTNTGIKLSGNDSLIYVGGGSAELVLEDGVTLQNNHLTGNSGATVYVGYSDGKGTLTIKDGVTIRNNSSQQSSGGAIYVYQNSGGVLKMEGGEIYGNYSGADGGAVKNLGTFEMTGGKIYNNVSAAHGGAVSSTEAFTMSGGEIYSNKTNQGGGGITAFSGTTKITGGSVTGNAITGSMGGGVLYYGGSLEVSGQPVITGNTGKNVEGVSDKANNVYLLNNKKISVSEPLSDGAQIGVTTSSLPGEGASVDITGSNTADYSSCFLSDNKNYDVVLKGAGDNTVCLVKHTHKYGTEWEKDSTDHWHECRCGEESDKAAHVSDEGKVTKEPTEAEEGIKTYCCSICGYELRTESIDRLEPSDTGKVEVDKEQGANTPATEIETAKEALIQAVLSPEEQSNIAKGTDVKILLTIENIDASVTEADKQRVTAKAENYTVGQYLDIQLLKIVDGNKMVVPETNGKIRIVVTVPESLKNKDAKKARSFAVVRVHNGVAEILSDLDKRDDTVTIETDKFSTYALVYRDTDNSNNSNNSNSNNNNSNSSNSSNSNNNNSNNSNNNNSNNNSNNNNNNSNNSNNTTKNIKNITNNTNNTDSDTGNAPKTGDTAPVEVCATMAMVAGLSWLLLYFGNRKRGMSEQKKKEITAYFVAWGRKGGRLRKWIAISIIFVILVYYHSIGKKCNVDWEMAR